MNAGPSEARSFRCPTCAARQVLSAECRRCKCDLTLVRAVQYRAGTLHQECLRHLQRGAYRQALVCALRRRQLVPDPTSARLLAVSYLHLGNFPAALAIRDEQKPG